MVDDLIDVTGGEEAGKDLGKDLKKTTFVSFSGVEGAHALARELIAASGRVFQQVAPAFGEQFAARSLFEQVTGGPGRQRVEDMVGVLVHREHHDLGLGKELL